MLSSILLYLDDEVRAAPAIQLAVQLARRANARVRGVTLVDTRHHKEACTQESAAFTTLASAALHLAEQRQQGVRHKLSNACLHAKVNFDVRRFAGDPVDVLAREARFHDLVIASGFVGNESLGLTAGDLIGLVQRRASPLLVLHPQQSPLERVLLVYDGTESASRAIQSYLKLGPLAGADHRLLAIGKNEDTAREYLSEVLEYCIARCPDLESGCVVGQTRRALVPYVNKWQADLTVMGCSSDGRLMRRIFGDSLLDLLKHTSCAWWAMS